MRHLLWMSYRYLIGRHDDRFLSIISLIAIAGVAIGVAALIVVLAVMTGFGQELREKIMGTYAHIQVEGLQGLENSTSLQQSLKAIPHVQSACAYLNGQVFLSFQESCMGRVLRGLDPTGLKDTTQISRYLIKGKSELSREGVLVGKELANHLGIEVGDVVLVAAAFLGSPTPLKVEGIFYSGMYDYDMNLVITNLETAQQVLGLPGVSSGVALRLDNIYLADEVKREILKKIAPAYRVRTWAEINPNYFSALKLEKITMFILLTLIILVASFNIISALIVMVTEKTKDIGILKALGMLPSSIRLVFTLVGLWIGVLGTGCGLTIGVILCNLLKRYQFIRLPQDVYYIDRLPVYMKWQDIACICAASMVISLIATVHPAARAARLRPVEALRYE